MTESKLFHRMLMITLCTFLCGLALFLLSNTVSADSLMDAGRAYGVYNRPGQTGSTSSSGNSSGWSPKFGDFYDAYREIKNLVTGNKQDSGSSAPAGVSPSASYGVGKVAGRVGDGVNRMTGAVDNFDRIMNGDSRFDSETADLLIDRVPAAVNLSSSITGESTTGVVGGYVQDLTDRVDPNSVNNYTRNAGWTKVTDSWLRSTGSFGISDETQEYREGIKIYNKYGRDAYQKYISDRIKNDPDYLKAKEKGDAARGYSSKEALKSYYRRTYSSNTKGLEGSPNEKPNIYLYPEVKTDIKVALSLPDQIMVSIPSYPDGGWEVTAYPDGRLTCGGGSEYDYLFYESEVFLDSFQNEYAFYLPSEAKAETFERILSLYGLNGNEIKDFTEYWCERLPAGKDYYMYPQLSETCDRTSPLEIFPAPDTLFRLWFVYTETEEKDPDIKEPVTEKLIRKGFTVVEWGGIVY